MYFASISCVCIILFSYGLQYILQINLLERQELQQRVKLYCMNRGPPEHWQINGMFKRVELQKALGNHLSWKDR
jgi:hypothetical protein